MSKVIYAFTENSKDALIDIAGDISAKVIKAANWMLNNPELVIGGLTSLTMLLRASRLLVVSQRVYSERNRINHTYYDPHTGHHWDLRRKLNNNDRIEISRRSKDGEDMYDILRSMGVLR